MSGSRGLAHFNSGLGANAKLEQLSVSDKTVLSAHAVTAGEGRRGETWYNASEQIRRLGGVKSEDRQIHVRPRLAPPRAR